MICWTRKQEHVVTFPNGILKIKPDILDLGLERKLDHHGRGNVVQ